MTIRVTVHNAESTAESIVAVRQMTHVGGDVVSGPHWFLGQGKQQDFYLHDHQFIVAIEVKRGSPFYPATEALPDPTIPQPLPELTP